MIVSNGRFDLHKNAVPSIDSNQDRDLRQKVKSAPERPRPDYRRYSPFHLHT